MKGLAFLLFLWASAAQAIVLDGGVILNRATRRVWDRGPIIPNGGFAITIQEPAQVLRALAGTSGPVTIEDRNYTQIIGGSTVTDYAWNWVPAETNTTEGTVSRSSDNNSIIIPTTGNPYLWTYVGSGTTTIHLMTSTGQNYTRSITTSTAAGATTYTFLSYATGSLRKAMTDAYDGRLLGCTPAVNMRVFSTYSPSSATYVRNENCWASDGFDLSAISPGNSESNNLWAGVMVSPRHFIVCAHASMGTGGLLHLVSMDGTLVTRTITAITTAPGYTSYYPDWRVGVLDSDVPTTGPGAIKIAKVLPDNWGTKIPSLSSSNPVPALCLDQEEKAISTDLFSLTSAAGMYGAMADFQIPTNLQRQAFYEPKVGGDSGNPAFLMIGNDLVLTNVWTFGGPGRGTSITYWKAAINTIMTALGGGHQLTEVNLSAFNSY